MAKSYDVWFSFGVNLKLDDPEDYDEIARKAKPKIQEMIDESVGDYIDGIEEYDDREHPCMDDECDGEYIYERSYPTHFETITVYKCDRCGDTKSFP
jgi:hypothetical protein